MIKLVAKTAKGKQLIVSMIALGFVSWITNLASTASFFMMSFSIVYPLINGDSPNFKKVIGWVISFILLNIFNIACRTVLKDSTKIILDDKINFE